MFRIFFIEIKIPSDPIKEINQQNSFKYIYLIKTNLYNIQLHLKRSGHNLILLQK